MSTAADSTADSAEIGPFNVLKDLGQFVVTPDITGINPMLILGTNGTAVGVKRRSVPTHRHTR
ncbi:hypothetical protein SAMN04489740_4367 [Arthrobacter alpinus]|uniref:Uncharacterized protein n=1 Tax=Arthrobacter alpinus TaxID=656366 RepID=A0A1H5PI20_9MICC|nr:hypothetical protein [Arthrobacter alpinus]SEF13376.1 hypothetical protein SAMN04489740_4367 [Arthrobacter alpinus]